MTQSPPSLLTPSLLLWARRDTSGKNSPMKPASNVWPLKPVYYEKRINAAREMSIGGDCKRVGVPGASTDALWGLLNDSLTVRLTDTIVLWTRHFEPDRNSVCASMTPNNSSHRGKQ